MLRLRDRWEELDELNPCTTLFQSFAWNIAAARLFAEREHPEVIYCENDNGAALLPCAVAQRTGQLTLLGESLFDYRDVLVAGDEQALLDAWECAAEKGLDFSAGALRSDANFGFWRGFETSPFYGAPRVSPAQISNDQFASEHSRLGRWFRKLEKMGATFRVHPGTNSQLVREIYQHKAEQPPGSGDNLFSDPLRQQFMVEVCAEPASRCEIFTMESAGTLVSALVTFVDRNVRRFYTIYFDMSWAKYSPGMCLVFEVTRRSLAEGLECDYMTGEHGYKTRLATSVVPMYWVQASASRVALLGQPATATEVPSAA